MKSQQNKTKNTTITSVPVNSPAFVFSPGNWTGNKGRSGSEFRQTWYTNAYCRITWTCSTEKSKATLLLDPTVYPNRFKRPTFSYCMDGVWEIDVPIRERIKVKHLKGSGDHTLTVLFTNTTPETGRWGAPGQDGINILRVTGLELDTNSRPVKSAPAKNWALIVGDSITANIATAPLTGYSYLLGRALQTQGYEFGMSACGYSGWLNPGDTPPGDVPGYYVSQDGTYQDSLSRWNKIDGNNHSLLDTAKCISAYGKTDQEPSLILINYGTNDVLHGSDPSDVSLSIQGALAALRQSAPKATIILIVPFGQYVAGLIKKAVKAYRNLAPKDKAVHLIDLGPEAANAIAVNGAFGGLHPNERGHANFAAQVIPQVISLIR